LEEAFDSATAGETHVIGGNHLAKANGPTGWKSCNLRTTFSKLVKRAGLEPWPRLFHNLRASRETELLEEFPVHVVAQWMGHDAKVSLKHYAQTTEDHFDRAVGGANSDAQATQNPAQQITAENREEPSKLTEMEAAKGVTAGSCELSRDAAQTFNGERGIRTLVTVSRKQHFQCCLFNHSSTSPNGTVYLPKGDRQLDAGMDSEVRPLVAVWRKRTAPLNRSWTTKLTASSGRS
jgi:hypothetical protein